MPVDGGAPRLLVPDAVFPMYFPDGDRITVVDPALDLAGRDISIIAAMDHARPRDRRGARVVPKHVARKRRIAYLNGSTIRIVDVETGGSTSFPRGNCRSFGDDRLDRPGSVGAW